MALVESWLAAQRAYDNVPGLSAAIVHGQDLAWSGGFGLADVMLMTCLESDRRDIPFSFKGSKLPHQGIAVCF